jgi:hypothetical protein
VDLLGGSERVGGTEYLGAVLRERDVDRRGVLSVDGGEAVGVKIPPQPVVRVRKALLCVAQPLGELGVLRQPSHELDGELARRLGIAPLITHRPFVSPTPPAQPTNVTVAVAQPAGVHRGRGGRGSGSADRRAR